MRYNSYVFNSLEDIFHSQRYHSRNTVTPHHGESLSRRSLPISKYGSCGSNTEEIYTQNKHHAATVSVLNNTLPKDRSHCSQFLLHTIVSLNSGNNQRLCNVLVQLIGCFLISEHSVCKQQRRKINVQ